MKNTIKVHTIMPVESTLKAIHAHVLEKSSKYPGSKFCIALSEDAWTYFVATPTLYNAFNPSATQEEVTTGKLGTLLGVPLVTDAYLPKRFLPKGISICEVLNA